MKKTLGNLETNKLKLFQQISTKTSARRQKTKGKRQKAEGRRKESLYSKLFNFFEQVGYFLQPGLERLPKSKSNFSQHLDP